MPAIDPYLTMALSVPGWVWVAIAVVLAAAALSDDRTGKIQSGVAVMWSAPSDVRIVVGTAVVGFAVGWVASPTQLFDLVVGAL